NLLTDAGMAPGLLIQDNLIGTSQFQNGTDQGNAGQGINFDVRETSMIEGLHILSNAISFNGAGGVNFERRDNVTVDDFLIDDKRIELNTGNGIRMSANNS